MTGRADRWIRRTTFGCVELLALIAGTVSYLHMHLLVEMHGQPGWVAPLTPLSVDGMIAAASTTLLADSRSGRRGSLLPWALLVVGSAASLAANVAVAQPTVTGRVIAAWPSFSLIAAYELLMRQVRAAADGLGSARRVKRSSPGSAPDLAGSHLVPLRQGAAGAGTGLQRRAWEWAGEPGRRWQLAYRQGYRSAVRSARAVGSSGQGARRGVTVRRRRAKQHWLGRRLHDDH
jgi:Protein of unknown function (DUF2637)